MTDDERLRHNAEYWGVTIKQAREVEAWLAVRMSDYPSWLAWSLGAKLSGESICGDLMACKIAEAVKENWSTR